MVAAEATDAAAALRDNRHSEDGACRDDAETAQHGIAYLTRRMARRQPPDQCVRRKRTTTWL